MSDGSKQQPKVTAGLDLGHKYSYSCLIDQESGQVIEEGRMRTTPEAFRRRFASEQPMRIAIEAGTHSPWASRVLEGCGHEILVANARKLRLIYSNKRKTDEVDAENLARLARLDPKLLYPLKHRGEEACGAAAQSVGERRTLRAAAQHPPLWWSGSLKEKEAKPKTKRRRR
jgi:transposase